jgi:hypothetical protein
MEGDVGRGSVPVRFGPRDVHGEGRPRRDAQTLRCGVSLGCGRASDRSTDFR